MGKELTVVGKLGKPHGISGAFRFSLSRELKNKMKLPKHFMIEVGGSALPWFVADFKLTGFADGMISFEEVNTPEKAKKLSGKELMLPADEAAQLFKKAAADYEELIGFIVYTEAGELGIIESIDEAPGQVLMKIVGEKNEYTIPFVDDFVLELNKRKKQMTLSLPEGLLEL